MCISTMTKSIVLENVLAIFGSWWGVIEFLTVMLLVTIMSALGATLFRTYFYPSSTRNVGMNKHSVKSVEEDENDHLLTSLDQHPPYSWIGHLGSALSNPGGSSNDVDSDGRSGVVDEVKEIVNAETSAALADMTPNLYRDTLHRRIANRTYHVLGLPLDSKSDNDYSPWPLMTETPFNTIEIRVGTQSAALAALYIIDGNLPSGETMPLLLDIDICEVSDTEDGITKESNRLTYRSIQVNRLSSPILLQSDSSPTTLFEPGSRVLVRITEAKRGTVYYSGPSLIQTPIPKISTIFACQDLVVMRIEAPYVQSGEVLVDYPSGTLNDSRYESEFPHHMPVLNERGRKLILSQLTLVNTTPDSYQTKGPITKLIYADLKRTDNVPFDRTTYRSFAEASSAQTDITVIENPARPGERYVALRRIQDDKSHLTDHLIGWSIGFFSSDKGSGINIVFPAGEEPSLADTVDISKHLVLQNNDRAVGIFHRRIGDPSLKGGAPTSHTFFTQDIEPSLLVRPDNGQVIALVHGPSGTMWGEHQNQLPTHLLPYNIIKVVPPPMEHQYHRHHYPKLTQMLKIMVAGGETIESPIGSTDDHVPYLLAIPCGHNNINPKHSSRIVRLQNDIYHTTKSLNVMGVTIYFPRTGAVFRTLIQPHTRGQGLMVLDGIADNEIGNMKISVIPMKGLPYYLQEPHGGYAIVFSGPKPMIKPSTTEATGATGSVATLYVCRTSSKPATSYDGQRPPENILTTLGLTDWLFDDDDDNGNDDESWTLPRWALKGNGVTWGRHIFALALRYSEVNCQHSDITRLLKKSILDSVEGAESTSLSATNSDIDRLKKYSSGALENARKIIGRDDSNHDAVRQAALASNTGSMNGLWVLGSDGSRVEKLLHDAFVVGPWGIVVFGANPSPPLPVNEVDIPSWRNRSPLSLGGSGDILTDFQLPLRPVLYRLPVWKGGEPILWIEDDRRAIVRLDPRLVTEGALIALGFPKKNVGLGRVLLQVDYNPASGKVHNVYRLPIHYTAGSPPISKEQLQLLEANCDIPQERVCFNKDGTDVLCVLSEEVPDYFDGILSVIVDPIVFLCVATVSPKFEERVVFNAILGRKNTIFKKGMVDVPETFGTIAGFVLARPE
nr:MAG: wsv216-like protein [Penaeus semisulcatus pemonivirus]